MGIITHISTEYDEQEDLQRIFMVTKFNVATRSALNRLAARASTTTSAGQRTLVASAYEELGIDLVWSEGPFGSKTPEEKYPDAKEIDYHTFSQEDASDIPDMLGLGREDVPSLKLVEAMFDGFGNLRPDSQIHIWEIPTNVGGWSM